MTFEICVQPRRDEIAVVFSMQTNVACKRNGQFLAGVIIDGCEAGRSAAECNDIPLGASGASVDASSRRREAPVPPRRLLVCRRRASSSSSSRRGVGMRRQRRDGQRRSGR